MKLRIGVRIDMDTRRLSRAYARAERSALSRAGAYVRKLARSHMRRRSRAARPGEGPTVREGQLKTFLLWAYEPQRHTTVVGPKRLPGATADTPEAMEHGKVLTRWVGRGSRRRRQAIAYEKRPSTMPALGMAGPDLPDFWRDAVR